MFIRILFHVPWVNGYFFPCGYLPHVTKNDKLDACMWQDEDITFISLAAFRPSPCWPKSSISTCSALPPFSLNHWVKLAMWSFREWSNFSNKVWSAKHKSKCFSTCFDTLRWLVTISSKLVTNDCPFMWSVNKKWLVLICQRSCVWLLESSLNCCQPP